MVYSDRFTKFLALLLQRFPNILIKFKNESNFMKLLGFLSFFNKKFMTNYTTVVGNTIYFPDKEYLGEANGNSPIITLAHESRHMFDIGSGIKSFICRLWYFFPQILAPLMLLFLLLPISYAISIPLSVILFLACLAPTPSYSRKYYEEKGYIVNLFMLNELYKEHNLSEVQRRGMLESSAVYINGIFTSSSYYYMWPFGIKDELSKAVDKILKDELVIEDEFFKNLRQDLKNSK